MNEYVTLLQSGHFKICVFPLPFYIIFEVVMQYHCLLIIKTLSSNEPRKRSQSWDIGRGQRLVLSSPHHHQHHHHHHQIFATSGTTQPAIQTYTHCHICCTLTHAARTSFHCTPPTKAPTPCSQGYHQSLTPLYALTWCSFPKLTAAVFRISKFVVFK